MQNLKRALVLSVCLPWVAMAAETVDKTWNVAADARITVENTAGEIIVQGWDRNEVHLIAELGKSVKNLDIDESSSGLQIHVENRNGRNTDATDLLLKVPVSALVDVTGVSADIQISGLDNTKVKASSVSGKVEVKSNSGSVSLESVSGDVTFNGKASRISAESVSGDIELTGVSGMVDANTVSGDIEMLAGELESGKFETVSGDILLTAELSGNGKLGAQSMSGDITANLPAMQSGSFKAQSFSGRISSDFGTVSKPAHGPGSHLKYVVGKSGAEIKLESFSGDVRLLSQ